jgi:ribosomal protein S18 acetylase RimI-like enzyme
MNDVALVFELTDAAAMHDAGERLLDIDDIETDWRHPGLDITSNTVLVFDGDRLVAWAQIHGERADADVHPECRGRGIGRAVVEWTESRAIEVAVPGEPVRIGQTLLDGLEGTDELFLGRGYERLWDSWILRFPRDLPPIVAPLPDTVTLRSFRSGDERVMYKIIDDAFSEWEDRESQPFDAWYARTIDRNVFHPDLVVVAEIDGVPIGVSVSVMYADEGWIDQVAVIPEHRGKGVARAMLAESRRRFQQRGQDWVGLNTDSRTGALGLYLGVGMVLERTFVRFSKLVRPVQG